MASLDYGYFNALVTSPVVKLWFPLHHEGLSVNQLCPSAASIIPSLTLITKSSQSRDERKVPNIAVIVPSTLPLQTYGAKRRALLSNLRATLTYVNWRRVVNLSKVVTIIVRTFNGSHRQLFNVSVKWQISCLIASNIYFCTVNIIPCAPIEYKLNVLALEIYETMLVGWVVTLSTSRWP